VDAAPPDGADHGQRLSFESMTLARDSSPNPEYHGDGQSVAASFDEVSKDWLIRFVEHRIGDKRIIRLIQKWLKAGILEDGIVAVSDKGTGQGAVISPLLANIYLHYALDLWPNAGESARPRAT